MASTRSSSPASRGGSPEPLTPRTKIRALLATVQSSDEEDGAEPKTKPSTRISPSIRLGRLPGQSPREDSDGDSDVEIRPRGRLASRMQGAVTVPTGPTATVTESVQERVPVTTENETEPTREGDLADIEDEDDLPVAPRRLKRRAPRAATPDTTEQTAEPQSPGLFFSSPAGPSPTKSTGHDSGSDQELPTLKSDRFKALVERKRQERLAREAAEEARMAERRAQQEKLASELEQLDSEDGNVSSITDDEGGRKLTQEARPTRKASRKAIEEMTRETQRMARNMQLAQEAKTRKRITTASLFERFNYRPAGEPQPEPKTNSSSRPTTPQTDVEMKDVETPPSSPPVAKKQDQVDSLHDSDIIMVVDEDAKSASLAESNNPTTVQTLDKGKGKAVEIEQQELSKPALKAKRQIRVKLPMTATNMVTIDSDDELEITRQTKHKLDAVFNNIPVKKAQEARGFQALRTLAQVKSPGKGNRRRMNEPTSLTPGEFQAQLHQRARQQAKLERDRRMEMLKAKGVVVQTAEEREREMQEVEDIVGRAREEAQKIMELERAAAKKERKESGEADPLAWDDSDDEEYQDSANEADGEASALELSGSEDEEEEEQEDGENADEDTPIALFDNEADDAGSEASEADVEATKIVEAAHEEEDDDEADDLPVSKQRRARKHVAVLSDEEEEASIEATPKPKSKTQVTPGGPKTDSPAAPTSVLRSAKKTFIPGLPVEGPAGLGLTQIFAGTMDDSQMSPSNGPTQSMMPDFEHFPDSNFSATADEPVEDMVMDSQKEETQASTQGVEFNLSQSQMRGLDSLLQDGMHTQISELEPSQDEGIQEYTPLKDRFIEPPFSTVETVVADPPDASNESPLVRRGRFRRRMETVVEDDSVPVGTETTETAFSILQDGAEKEKKRKLIDDFNRKKSKAKEMVYEQAEESEDEYAGIGGADGEDSDNESLASVKELIDDQAGNDLDESKLAAFYADRARASDEKEVEKLFKDITTGQLRRKRGADYDLSDSDDGGEARRRMKRRQFAKMQKALFTDERVKKMAENPGNQAFLRTMEDRGSDDEMEFLDVVEEPSQPDSQSQEDTAAPLQTIPDSQPRKPLGAAGENRAPAHPRRTKDGKKPSNIGEVRETLSNLLDDRHGSVIPATEAGSDSDGDEDDPSQTRSDKENDQPNPRRGRTAVVDRISLKRNSSSSVSTNSTRLAFAAAPSSSASFKVPALLRRATTNSLMSGTSSTSKSSTGVSTHTGASAAGFGDEAKVKKTASKKSGVNAFARENERRARMQESERRREEKKVRGAEKRMGVVGGLLGKGSFE